MDKRNKFKKVFVDGVTFLYPQPVIKNKKYLIEVKSRDADLFILLFDLHFLELPDESPDYLIDGRVHIDEQTRIYEIDLSLLKFKFLINGEKDPEKAAVIEGLLTKKILSTFNGEEGARDAFLKAIEKQQKCSTCQSLGILDDRITKLIEFYEGNYE